MKVVQTENREMCWERSVRRSYTVHEQLFFEHPFSGLSRGLEKKKEGSSRFEQGSPIF